MKQTDTNLERLVWWLAPEREHLRNDPQWNEVFAHLCALEPIPVRVDEVAQQDYSSAQDALFPF